VAWSIFTQGGGAEVAVGWAEQLLSEIGAPASAGNVQFIYDWEVSEGGGGAYNPLNQGPVPGQPALTTTGSQFGGGAADFASWAAGLTGAADYLAMPAYAGVKSGLLANDPTAARSALIASPWAASHYGNGADFSDAAVPGGKAVLPASGVSTPATTASILDPLSGITSGITDLGTTIRNFAITAPIVLAGAAMVVLGIVHATGGGKRIAAAAPVAAEAAAL